MKKIKLIAGTYIDSINKDINIANFQDLDGSKLRELLENDGYNIIGNYDTGRNGLVVTDDGFCVSTNGYTYKK